MKSIVSFVLYLQLALGELAQLLAERHTNNTRLKHNYHNALSQGLTNFTQQGTEAHHKYIQYSSFNRTSPGLVQLTISCSNSFLQLKESRPLYSFNNVFKWTHIHPTVYDFIIQCCPGYYTHVCVCVLEKALYRFPYMILLKTLLFNSPNS